MTTEQEGSFRIRTWDDGSLEVWARGWRLESQLYALIPMWLSLMFVVAPMPVPMRAVGALVMLAATLFVFRMTKPGLRFTEEAVAIVSVGRTQRFRWEEVTGFMGERRHDEGRVHLILADERRIPLPGTLDPAELDPYGDEGELLSAADQLNRLQERAIARELPRPAAPVVVHAPDPRSDHPTRKERRRERKELRAALKAVRLTPEDTTAPVAAPEGEPTHSRRWRRIPRTEPAPELVEVTIAEPEGVSVATPASMEPTGPASYFPTPVYIPQAEYAQMLRDQKAAEKAAVEAAAELRRLANLEQPDELAKEEEFSDWTS
ncbi:MAG: PH domain-containing protein [Actinomycetota bacterium]|nr:PH domain-containing protein [Actinomycetota bacterium]